MVLVLQGVMGIKFEYLPKPFVCEELNWLFLPCNEVYLVTKLEYVEVNETVVHCKDEFGDAIVLYDCSFDFLVQMRQYFKVGVDVEEHDISFKKNGIIDFRVFEA